MTGRRAAHDELVPVEPADAPPTTATAVHLAPTGRRWPAVAVLVAVLAAVAGIGLLTDEDGSADATPTTTTTQRPSTTRSTTEHRLLTNDPVALGGRGTALPRTTTTVVTTTTSWPQYVHGTGPVLPEAVDTYVLTTGSDGRITVLDLDTGDACTTDPPGSNAWQPGPISPELDGGALVQIDAGWTRVDRTCAVDVISPADQSWPTAFGGDRFWLVTQGSDVLTEMSARGKTGRVVHAHTDSGAFVATGHGLVASAAGQMTLIDPDTDARTDLGSGNPMAGGVDVLVFQTCPLLECHLSVMDLRDRSVRQLDGAPSTAWATGSVFEDRLLATVGGQNEDVYPIVVDLGSGDVTRFEGQSMLGFSADGAWAFVLDGQDVVAHRLGSTDRVDITTAVNGASVFHPK